MKQTCPPIAANAIVALTELSSRLCIFNCIFSKPRLLSAAMYFLPSLKLHHQTNLPVYINPTRRPGLYVEQTVIIADTTKIIINC